MKGFPKTVLAAKAALACALIAAMPPAHASGIPTVDILNLVPNLLTSVEDVAQTLKQIEEYRTQLEQYQNMIQNTMQPASYLWDEANSTINQLMSAVNTLRYYEKQLGSVDQYLNNFQDADYWRGNPCFSTSGCSQAQWEAMQRRERLGSEAQKRANDGVLRGISAQSTELERDAQRLRRLQGNSQSAEGQMEALQYANQFASAQTNQLMQIRGLLIAQANAATARAQAVSDREARELAAGDKFRAGNYAARAGQQW